MVGYLNFCLEGKRNKGKLNIKWIKKGTLILAERGGFLVFFVVYMALLFLTRL